MTHRPLVIVGAGGLGSEFAWVAEEMNAWKILGYADDDPEKVGQTLGAYTVQGTVEGAAAMFKGQEIHFAVGVGDNATRQHLVGRAEAAGWRPATLVHPTVILASDAKIGAGSYIAPGCVVCPRAQLGEHVIVNVHVSVGHDSILEDYSQVCPGARISGGCRLGRLAFVGSNGSLTPGITVGEGAVVGANSHAVRNVAPGATVIGCPAKSLYAPGERKHSGAGDQRHG